MKDYTLAAWLFLSCGCLMIGFGLGRLIERNENVGQIALLRAQMAGKCFYKDQTAATMCVAPDRHVRVVCNDSDGCGSIKLETLEQFDRPKAAPVASKE